MAKEKASILTYRVIKWSNVVPHSSDEELSTIRVFYRSDYSYYPSGFVDGPIWRGYIYTAPEKLIELISPCKITVVSRSPFDYIKIEGDPSDLILIKLAWDPEWGTLYTEEEL